MPVLRHFLFVFDHAKGELVNTFDFESNSDLAVARYAELEAEYKDSDFIEIVLIGSDSLATIRITHANYFNGSVAVGASKYLAGI